jgi:hypothetical protein
MMTWELPRLPVPRALHRPLVATQVVVAVHLAARQAEAHVRSLQHRPIPMMILMTAIPLRISRI